MCDQSSIDPQPDIGDYKFAEKQARHEGLSHDGRVSRLCHDRIHMSPFVPRGLFRCLVLHHPSPLILHDCVYVCVCVQESHGLKCTSVYGFVGYKIYVVKLDENTR